MSRSLFVLVLASAGCTVQDADRLAAPAIAEVTVVVDPARVPDLKVDLTGGVALGYTSAELAHVTVLDNGVEVYSTSLSAETSPLSFDATVDLLEPGVNDVAVIAEYAGQTARWEGSVVVPDPVQSFDVAPATASVSQYEVAVTGTAVFGHRGAEPAVLEVEVEGGTVHTETIPVPSDTLSVPLSFTVPLAHEGPNAVVATLLYDGQSFARRFTVGLDMAPPTVQFPAWQTLYDEGVELVAFGDVTVTPAAGYTVERVQWSVDGRPWTDAIDKGSNLWTVAIHDPDIGASSVVLQVTTSTGGHDEVNTFYGSLDVDPIFDCDSTGSMLPDNDLIQNVGTEQRLMVGYFGQPGGGHVVQFVIDGRPNGDDYVVVGNNTRYNPSGIETQFNVNRFSCGDSCTTDYGLTAYVDGVEVCRDSSFGGIHDF